MKLSIEAKVVRETTAVCAFALVGLPCIDLLNWNSTAANLFGAAGLLAIGFAVVKYFKFFYGGKKPNENA